MASNLGTENGITVRIMKTEEYDDVKLFLRDNFIGDEPLLSCGLEELAKCPDTTLDDINLSLIKDGTSLIAIDDSSNSIVGVVIAGVQDLNDIKEHHLKSEQIEQHIVGRIYRLLMYAEVKSNIFEKYNIDKVLYSHITSVHAARRGQGLGARLASILMQVGRDKGLPAMNAYCTSFYSARQKEKLGMECLFAQTYADYKDKDGNVIFTPPPPHTQVKTLAIRL